MDRRQYSTLKVLDNHLIGIPIIFCRKYFTDLPAMPLTSTGALPEDELRIETDSYPAFKNSL